MTTTSDLGSGVRPQMLRCDLTATNVYSTLVLALRDFRNSNGRDAATGDGDGNASWVALVLGMIVLDTLSGPPDRGVRNRWERLLSTHHVSSDANLIYKLRCSLLHGYGIPKLQDVGDRRILLTGDMTGYAVDTDKPGLAVVSVPVFCTHLVERIANQAKMSWDTSLINTDLQI